MSSSSSKCHLTSKDGVREVVWEGVGEGVWEGVKEGVKEEEEEEEKLMANEKDVEVMRE